MKKPPKALLFDPVQVSIIKGMLRRGDLQMDIGIWFGVNQARINEVKMNKRQHYRGVTPAAPETLPPKGPYVVVTRNYYEEAERSKYAAKIVADLQSLVSKYKSELEPTIILGT